MISQYKDKKVVIVGFGVSGVSAAKYLLKQGACVVVADLKEEAFLVDSMHACAGLPIEYCFGELDETVLTTSALIVVSPGVPLTLKPLEEAKLRGIPITNEIELAVSVIEEPIIAVTGTNGKTTTTTLIGEMLKADGRSVFVGGNIGKPLLDYVLEGKKVDFIITELSSFQLELVRTLSPRVAVFTNIYENHLDRYRNFEAYIEAKKRLLMLCHKNTFVVLNEDNKTTQKFNEHCQGELWGFTKESSFSQTGFSGGAYLDSKNKKITLKYMGKQEGKDEVYDISLFRLLGEHNRENLMAAIIAAQVLGVQVPSIQKVINEFKVIPHRLEFIRKKDGVFFFNDSKGTNVQSLQKSLSCFSEHSVILIAGGKDRGSDFSFLSELVKKKCKILILLGEAKEKINRMIGDHAETYLVGTFEEAVLLAYQKSRSGDVILLSPGCPSYDIFRNFEERGEYFRKLVLQL